MSMRNATLVFLAKRSDAGVTEICLAMKKRGFGAGRWNGAGGKVHEGETIEAAAARETEEEIRVTPRGLEKAAELRFEFAGKPEWDQTVHAYLSEAWDGEPCESEEMAPRWFAVADIPYAEMWPDDIYWLPLVIAGKKVRARFKFGDKDAILEQSVEEAAAL